MRNILFAMVLSFSCSAQVPPNPYAVKDDRLGETLMEWKANNLDLDSCTTQNLNGDSRISSDIVSCSPRPGLDGQTLSFAGVPLLMETAWFYKGNLYKVEMILASRRGVPSVMASLIQNLGTHSAKESKASRDGFGFRFDQKSWTWRNKVSTVEFKFSNSVNASPQVTFTLNGGASTLIEANRRQALGVLDERASAP